MRSTIFIIDSSPAVRRMVEQISEPEGYEVVGFHDGPTALDAARKQSPALIIADYHLENMTFSGFCKEIVKQDNLAETMIVSIVDATDRLDENKLRSLGVRSFLKKPFQGEQLLEAIKSVLHGGKQKSDGRPMKSRTWPPVSTATDNDEEYQSDLETVLDEETTGFENRAKESSAMSSSSQSEHQPAPMTQVSSPGNGGEELMKRLFDHLMTSVVAQAERKILEILPSAIAKEVAAKLTNAVQTTVQEEVGKQAAEMMKPEKMQAGLLEMVRAELDRQSSSYMTRVETTVRQSVNDLAPALVQKAAENQLRDLVDAGMKEHLPTALREQMSSIEAFVKSEVQQVASSHARQDAEEIVREMVYEPLQQAIQRIVPDVAESQVREEIKRLSAAE
jgi:DNA-binding response OmpR family regulator